MSCVIFDKEDYTLELNDSSKGVSKLHIIKFNDEKYVFLEAVQKKNPSEFSVEVYQALQNFTNNKEVYLDLSNLYGINNNSWLVKWRFITSEENELIDEEFYTLKEIEQPQKDEYIIIKNYITNKQSIYS